MIVVGIDGSRGSAAALHWAAWQAISTGAVLRIVVAWELPTSADCPSSFEDPDSPKRATWAADKAIGELSDDELPSRMRTRVVHGHAGTVLVEQSRDADLLVVGSRGHGITAGMLIGSIGQYCSQHAACPVVVVRDQQD